MSLVSINVDILTPPHLHPPHLHPHLPPLYLCDVYHNPSIIILMLSQKKS